MEIKKDLTKSREIELTDWKVAWKRLSGTRFLPRSRKVSTMEVFSLSVVPSISRSDLMLESPGWMMSTQARPTMAAKREVRRK